MPQAPTQADLEAYLDEAATSVEEMGASSSARLRDDPTLAAQLYRQSTLCDAMPACIRWARFSARHRLNCPTRDQLGSYLLKALDADVAGFVDFHVNISGCRRMPGESLEDLKSRQTDEPAAVTSRRKKYFQSSAGHLRRH